MITTIENTIRELALEEQSAGNAATLESLTAKFRHEGFISGAPSTVDHAARTIDAAMCAEAQCGNCGHEGLTYHPFKYHRGGNGYRIVAACPICGHAEEF